jgi:hypothetical protein
LVVSHYIFTRKTVENEQPCKQKFLQFVRTMSRRGVNAELGGGSDDSWRYIRHERLEEDLRSVCSALSLPMVAIPNHKVGGPKTPRPHYRAFYDAESRALVEENWKDWLKKFDYAY